MTQNIACLYRFRFIITEVHRQLDSLHKTRTKPLPSIIYRGTAVKAILLENLKENLNGLISMNGFVSASLNQQITNIYSGKGDPVRPGYERVLFKLPINDKIATRPYALIREFSDIPDEDEILFSAGTIWRINSINKDEEIWIIELELIKEDEDKRLIELTNYLKQQLGETSSLLTLGSFLTEIGEYEEAAEYYNILLTEFPDNHENIAAYINLGSIRYEQGEFNLAHGYFKSAIEHLNKKNNWNKNKIRKKDETDHEEPDNHKNIAAIYNNLGNIRYEQGKFDLAHGYFKSVSEHLNKKNNWNKNKIRKKDETDHEEPAVMDYEKMDISSHIDDEVNYGELHSQAGCAGRLPPPKSRFSSKNDIRACRLRCLLHKYIKLLLNLEDF
ncbi:unnamed protein product [Didymodactylos carnosus]|uniref:Uncharacterized protein n=1 Tax=Didymodactylos carnosus TaxID=1234261 RepID=A0A815R1Q5_9BILA|nr:unnamed protein product [Didymodactylos carnosus]CAF4338657.1 unnamed protein product [Didymodactylos carnosus]